MMSSLEGWSTKAKEALSPHEIRTLLKITAGQWSLTVVTAFVITKKFCRTVTITLNKH